MSTSRSERVGANPESLNMTCDVTCLDDCQRLAGAAFNISSRVFVVFLSGISENAMVHKASPEDWHRVITVNLEGAFLIARSFLPGMRNAGYGRFAFAGSVTSRLGTIGTSSYSSSKEGLKALSRVISCENASKGITSNALEIGYMNSGLTNTIPVSIRESILKQIPAGRFGNPSELTPILLMLEQASYMTGSGNFLIRWTLERPDTRTGVRIIRRHTSISGDRQMQPPGIGDGGKGICRSGIDMSLYRAPWKL